MSYHIWLGVLYLGTVQGVEALRCELNGGWPQCDTGTSEHPPTVCTSWWHDRMTLAGWVYTSSPSTIGFGYDSHLGPGRSCV